MTLPEGFSPFEHLQTTASSILRKLVRTEFRDVGDDDWDPDITTPRGSLRIACDPDDSDTGVMLLLRFFIFYFVIRNGEDFAPLIYGLLQTGEDVTATKYPQVQVFFKESRYDASLDERIPVQRMVSFRWREDDWTTANVNALALEIKNEFATPKLKWQCGRELYTYRDRSKPYDFQVNAFDKANAKEVIEACMRIQDEVEPDWDEFLRYHAREAPPPINQTKMIEGELVKYPNPLPIAFVEFAYAQLKYPKLRKPRILVDATGTKRGAIHYV